MAIGEREGESRWTSECVLVLAESADVVVVGRRLDGGVLVRIVGVVL